jgi:hypothetical protein
LDVLDGIPVPGFGSGFGNVQDLGDFPELQPVCAFEPHHFLLLVGKAFQQPADPKVFLVHGDVVIRDRNLGGILNGDEMILLLPLIVPAFVADGAYQVVLQMTDIPQAFLGTEQFQKNILQYIFRIRSVTYTNICKREEPVLLTADESFQVPQPGLCLVFLHFVRMD